MIYRAHLAVVALYFALTFIPSLAEAQQSRPLLVDVENMELTPIDQRAIALQNWTKAEKLKWMPKFKQAKQSELDFLRCDAPNSLNQFGEADYINFGATFPDKLPDFETLFVEKPIDAPHMLRVRAWRGVEGQLHVDAGYGFFSVLQYYSPDQKNALLNEITLAGWKESGSRVLTEQEHVFPRMMVRIFKQSDQKGPVSRALHMIEEKVFIDTKFQRRPGITLSCVDSVKK